MARLMVIPIQDKGDAVLIIADRAGVTLIGFIAQRTLGDFFAHPPSMCECITFVHRHIESFEQILLHKSMKEACVEGSITCLEIEAIDLVSSGVAKSDWDELQR